MNTIIKARVGKVDEVTAGDGHLVAANGGVREKGDNAVRGVSNAIKEQNSRYERRISNLEAANSREELGLEGPHGRLKCGSLGHGEIERGFEQSNQNEIWREWR